MTYASGNYYQGDWKYDKKSGYGEMHWLTTNELYKGFWEENTQNGYGVHLWLEESGKLKTMRNRYEGMWFNGLRSGFGTFYYSDGSRYDGEWVNNQKEGFAVFIDPSGDIMEAIFKNDRLFQRLNEPRKIVMASLIPEASDDSEETNTKKKNSKVKTAGKKSGNTTMNNSRPQTRSGRPNRNLKSPPPEDVTMVKEQEFVKRNLENQVLNPYLELLRVDDLLETVRDKDEVLSNLQISLLSHNSTLMDIFKEYKALRDNVNDLSYTMTLKSLWQFLRNARVQSPILSLANFDRYFYANKFNIFPLFFNLKDLRTKIKTLKLTHYSSNPRKIDVLKKLDVYIRNDDVKLELSKIDYDDFEASVKAVDSQHWRQFEVDQHEKLLGDQMAHMKVKEFNMHDPCNIVQFRNFVDGLIRAIYVREDFNFENIGEDLSKKYMKLRVEPILNGRTHILGKPYAANEEVKLKRFIEDYLIMNKPELKLLFRKHLANRMSFEVQAYEQVSNICALRDLLDQSGYINNPKDELMFFKVVERYFDPDSSYLELFLKRVELNRHFNRMQTLELGSVSQHAESMELDMSQNSPGLSSQKQVPTVLPILGGLTKEPQTMELNANKDFHFEHIEEVDSLGTKQKQDGHPGAYPPTGQPSISLGNLATNFRQCIDATDEEKQRLSKRLVALMGHELLYFEFVENLLLFLLVNVIGILISGSLQTRYRQHQQDNRISQQSASQVIQQAFCSQSQVASY